MIYFLFQILLLLVLTISIGFLIKNKSLRFIIVFLGSFFTILEIIAIAFNGDFINHRYYSQLSLSDIWSVRGFFFGYIVLFSIILILLIFISLFIIKWLKSKNLKRLFIITFLIITLIGLSLPSGVFHNIYEIIQLQTVKKQSFNSALSELGIDPTNYTSKEALTAKSGKNIIVISLESLEKAYLQPPLQELTPHIQNLAKKYTFLDMKQQPGASWTSASMYTSITGIPAFFKSPSNKIFQGTQTTDIVNLGNVLSTAGYNTSYLVTKKEFSGMKDMFNAFGIEAKSEKDFQTNYNVTPWGLHDKDMFEELKKEILLKKSKKQPYAIFMATISGHFPNGLYDERMEKVLPKRDSNIEFMASAVDHYVGNLFQFLEKNNILDDTEVFIYPDHFLMGKSSAVLKKFKERGLYIISTAPKEKLETGINKPVYQMDIPQMIINGAGIQTNATFLSSFINENKWNYLKKNKKKLLALNEASLGRITYKEGFELNVKSDRVVLSALENDSKEIFPKEKNALNVIYFTPSLGFDHKKTIVHKEDQYARTNIGFTQSEINKAFKNHEGYALIYYTKQDSIYTYLKRGNQFGLIKAGEDEITYTKHDFSTFTGWEKIVQPTYKINEDEVFLKSSGYESIISHGTSRILLGFKPLEVKRGVNLLFIENNKYQVYHTDSFADKNATQKLIKKITELANSQKLVAILVHDATVKQLENHPEELTKLDLPKLANLEFRKPYIALYNHYSKNFEESIGETSIYKAIPLKKFPNPELEKIKQDTLRFIAHAGGKINNKTYTNSLEALNLNYKKGFRLFELDFIQTSDQKYVAAHDWKLWAKFTKYKGELPPDYKTFKNHPIDTLTPLSFTEVNQWFKNHPDAILVTDKINQPEFIHQHFYNKKRVMMELFSLQAIEKAKELGIEPMMSHNILRKIKGKELETLKELRVQYIAITRRTIKDDISLLKELKANGIKAYAFHIFGKEEFAIENESDYIYGIYADEWDFSSIESEIKEE